MVVALECGVRGVLPLLRFVFCDLIVESFFSFGEGWSSRSVGINSAVPHINARHSNLHCCESLAISAPGDDIAWTSWDGKCQGMASGNC